MKIVHKKILKLVESDLVDLDIIFNNLRKDPDLDKDGINYWNVSKAVDHLIRNGFVSGKLKDQVFVFSVTEKYKKYKERVG